MLQCGTDAAPQLCTIEPTSAAAKQSSARLPPIRGKIVPLS